MQQKYRYYWYQWQFSWQVYQSILVYLYRQDELEQLMDWAKRKRLGVFHHYRKLFYEDEVLLATKSIRYPQIFKWALVAYRVNKFLASAPEYYSKGYAAKYSTITQ